jgi:hypothetical protein
MTDDAHTDAEERYCPTCDGSFSAALDRCPNDGNRLVRIVTGRRLTGSSIDGRFDVYDPLGKGGMGTVYRGYQRSVGRDVAIKVIEPRGSSAAITRRFLREAKLASRLSHPNIVTVIDFGQTEDGALFLVMELVRGRTLSRVLADEGPFPLDRAVRVCVQLCDALEAAHGLEIVHRDLKPSNIMILDEPVGRDRVKVLDFGLAKSLSAGEPDASITQSDVIVGTPRYMPPEALTGEVAPRGDLYSLGVILWELLSGRPITQARTLSEIMAMHALGAPPALEAAPPALEALYARLMAKTPADRPQSAAVVRDALVALGALASSDSLRAVVPPAARGGRWRMGAIAGAAGGLVIALLAWLALRGTLTAPGGAALTDGSSAASVVVQPVTITASADGGPAADAGPALAARPRAADIELDLRSTPHATVTVNGRVVGTSPVRHRLPARAQPAEVVFARPGFRPYRTRVVPDRDRMLDVSLVRAPRAAPAAKFPF